MRVRLVDTELYPELHELMHAIMIDHEEEDVTMGDAEVVEPKTKRFRRRKNTRLPMPTLEALTEEIGIGNPER